MGYYAIIVNNFNFMNISLENHIVIDKNVDPMISVIALLSEQK